MLLPDCLYSMKFMSINMCAKFQNDIFIFGRAVGKRSLMLITLTRGFRHRF